MKIIADTNLLLRAYVADDAKQARQATEIMAEAELVAIGLQTLSEFVWVLSQHYQTSRNDIADAIRALSETHNVVLDRLSVAAGVAVLEAGGDFADGVIAHEGKGLGANTFVSFDKKATKILARQGFAVKHLA